MHRLNALVSAHRFRKSGARNYTAKGERLIIIGEKFGRLTVVRKAENTGRRVVWVCICDCGKETVTFGYDMKTGKTMSCGCLRAELMTKHGMYKTRFYSVWANMVSRCANKSNEYYGGRGITVCDRWENFLNFKEDMYESYQEHAKMYGEKNTTIERVDVNGNYEPDNVTWRTMQEQIVNRRPNKNNTSGHVGIGWVAGRDKWRARVTVNGKEHHLGLFDDVNEAVLAREDFLKNIKEGRSYG